MKKLSVLNVLCVVVVAGIIIATIAALITGYSWQQIFIAIDTFSIFK